MTKRKKADFVLTTSRHIGLLEGDDNVLLEEKIQKLSTEFKDAFKMDDEFERQILGNLKILNK